MSKNLLNKKYDNTYIYYILISLLAGLILNVMPCVFPILSIKLMSVFSADQNNIRVSFITTAFGIITSLYSQQMALWVVIILFLLGFLVFNRINFISVDSQDEI